MFIKLNTLMTADRSVSKMCTPGGHQCKTLPILGFQKKNAFSISPNQNSSSQNMAVQFLEIDTKDLKSKKI